MQKGPFRAPSNRLAHLLDVLTATDPPPTDPVVRRNSRVFASLLLGFVPVFASVDAVFLATVPGYWPPWYGYLVLGAIYFLNRRGHYAIAAPLLVAAFPTVGFIHLIAGISAGPATTLGYLSLTPMLGTILLSMRGVALLSVVNVAGIALMPWLAPGVSGLGDVVGPLSASAYATVLALVYMHHRNQIEADRQAELRESEQRLQLAIEAAAIGIWDWRVDEDRLMVTPSFEHIFGLPAGELGSRTVFMASVHPDDRARVEGAIRAGLAQADSGFELSFRIVRPDGTVRWLEARGRVVRDEAGPLRTMGTVSDVTARCTLEEQLRQAQKMEAIGRLAGGIAHDFNNLLMVIVGNLELMRDAKHGSRHADQIRQATESAAVLTRRLLALGRKSMLSPRSLDLNDALRDAGEMLRRIIGEDIEVRLELADDLPPIYVDGTMIEHVLLNLATNARDAMPQGGTLTIATRNLPGGRARSVVVMEVSDTGCGMDVHTRAHIFEPFFTTKQAGRGTGLGLSMVYGLISQSGGDIEVESSPGRGSTFRLHFPQAPDADLQPSPPTTREPAGRAPRPGVHILVIEDEPAVRQVCCEVLERAGYRVSSASDGASARAQLSAPDRSIDLVICDVVLPDASGPALIRDHAPLELPVLFMTGYAPGAEGDAPPADRTLRKPFASETLRQRVAALLEDVGLRSAS